MPNMDEVSALLEGPRAASAFLLRSLLDPPWSIRIRDESPLTVVAMVRGAAWVIPEAGPESRGAAAGSPGAVASRTAGIARIAEGEVAILRGPDPYVVADDPATEPQVVILPGDRCVTPDGTEVKAMSDLGVRTWGNSPDGAVQMLTGTYHMVGEVSRRLLEALPAVLVIPRELHRCALIPFLEAEIGQERPGQQAVLDRLLDLVLIDVLRAWFARPDAPGPAWYRAYDDPVVGQALQLLHARPDHPWTVASLAAEVGASRAALARRFTALIGEPPMAYLSGWRLALAADLFREPTSTVAAVARKVGYSTPFALSTAFKRAYGASPKEYRRAVIPSAATA